MSSYSSRHGGGSDSRRHGSSRRDSRSPPRRRRSRTPSPGPSKPRDPKSLPESFGRVQESAKPVDDDLNILQRMKTSYENSPLQNLYNCIKENKKIKIWTRNYKEVRGVMTGYIIAFDKHWNLIIKDVDEVYLKPKKSKTPFLRDIAPNENLPDIPAKVPRQRKTAGESGTEAAAAAPAEKEIKKEVKEGEEKKKKRRKKAKSTSAKRQVEQLFIRGDNIVMICPINEEMAVEDDEEEEEGEARGSG